MSSVHPSADQVSAPQRSAFRFARFALRAKKAPPGVSWVCFSRVQRMFQEKERLG